MFPPLLAAQLLPIVAHAPRMPVASLASDVLIVPPVVVNMAACPESAVRLKLEMVKFPAPAAVVNRLDPFAAVADNPPSTIGRLKLSAFAELLTMLPPKIIAAPPAVNGPAPASNVMPLNCEDDGKLLVVAVFTVPAKCKSSLPGVGAMLVDQFAAVAHKPLV